MPSSAHAMPLEHFQALTDFAREFNEYIAPEQFKIPAHAPSEASGNRPGDDYNRRATWEEILTPHDWQVSRTSGQVTYWTRPGKDPKLGLSATTGKCSSEHGGDLLYIFSSNAAPFDGDKAYSKFAAYTLLEHSGDFAKSAKHLAGMGYGEQNDGSLKLFIGEAPPLEVDRVIGESSLSRSFATNEDLKKLNLQQKWVWEGWLQFGVVNLLAAEGGMGKTRFVADLCRRVCQGLAWPDGKPMTLAAPGEFVAMWVAGDRNFAELVEISESFTFGEKICYSGTPADPTSGISLSGLSDFNDLYKKVAEAKPLFLVIDTAGGTTSANLSKQEDARQFFGPLSDIGVKLGLCVIVITHLNATKNVLGKRAEERVRCVIRMTAANREPETTRRLEIVKSNSLFPKPLGMNLGGEGNEYTDEAPPPPEDSMPGFGQKSDDPARGPSTKTRECMDLLEAQLAANPKRVSELRKTAEKAGFDAKCIYRAKEALNLIETVVENYKWWGLKTDT